MKLTQLTTTIGACIGTAIGTVYGTIYYFGSALVGQEGERMTPVVVAAAVGGSFGAAIGFNIGQLIESR